MGPAGENGNKAEYPNHVRSYDFLEDRTERGGKLRLLVIIDEYTRECLAMRIAPSIPARAVVEVLEWLFLTRGVPKHLRSDNGPEFLAEAVCEWLEKSGCQTIFITPGSPWENGYVESFIDKLRDECLNREVFRNGPEAQWLGGAMGARGERAGRPGGLRGGRGDRARGDCIAGVWAGCAKRRGHSLWWVGRWVGCRIDGRVCDRVVGA